MDLLWVLLICLLCYAFLLVVFLIVAFLVHKNKEESDQKYQYKNGVTRCCLDQTLCVGCLCSRNWRWHLLLEGFCIILMCVAWSAIIRIDDRKGAWMLLVCLILVVAKLVVQFLFTLCKPIWALLCAVVLTLAVLGYYIFYMVWEDNDDSWLEDNQDTAWVLLAAHSSIATVYLVDLVLYLLFGLCVKPQPDQAGEDKPKATQPNKPNDQPKATQPNKPNDQPKADTNTKPNDQVQTNTNTKPDESKDPLATKKTVQSQPDNRNGKPVENDDQQIKDEQQDKDNNVPAKNVSQPSQVRGENNPEEKVEEIVVEEEQRINTQGMKHESGAPPVTSTTSKNYMTVQQQQESDAPQPGSSQNVVITKTVTETKVEHRYEIEEVVDQGDDDETDKQNVSDLPELEQNEQQAKTVGGP